MIAAALEKLKAKQNAHKLLMERLTTTMQPPPRPFWEMPMDLDTQIGTQNQDENGNRYRYNSIVGEYKWMEK
jgi:hypothetical protein